MYLKLENVNFKKIIKEKAWWTNNQRKQVNSIHTAMVIRTLIKGVTNWHNAYLLKVKVKVILENKNSLNKSKKKLFHFITGIGWWCEISAKVNKEVNIIVWANLDFCF